jgi:hypothetical protein
LPERCKEEKKIFREAACAARSAEWRLCRRLGSFSKGAQADFLFMQLNLCRRRSWLLLPDMSGHPEMPPMLSIFAEPFVKRVTAA